MCACMAVSTMPGASAHTRTPVPRCSCSFCASKAALNALSETAQKEQEQRGTGVRVWALAPGIVDTAMQAHIRTAEAGQFSEADKFAGYHAEGQLQSADEVAGRITQWLQTSASAPVVVKLDTLLQ
ncbi:MAG: SDR family NAD(P)-dependent oxidoreductase [Hymenobacter sp.]|nr:MAG: SDR family NAD(P)-dependent oxidoreductase [Hymenobacter sp.]